MHLRFFLRIALGLVMIVAGAMSALHAQYATGLQLLPSTPNAAFDQPAWLGYSDSTQLAIGGMAGFGLASNAFSMDDLLLGDGLIDEADKSRIIDQVSDQYQLSLNTGADALVMFRLKNKLPISVSYQYRIDAGAVIPSRETMQLLLRGNTPYLGETLSDEEVRFRTQAYHAIGIGSAWQVKDVRVGVRLKALLGSQFLALDPFSYQLLTDSLGSSLSLSGEYQLDTKEDLNQLDLGVGMDLGLSWQLDDKWLFHAAATDLGWVGWRVQRVAQPSFDIDYEGVEVADILNIDQALSVDIADTLQEILFPDTVSATSWSPVGGRIAVGANWAVSETHMLGIQAIYHLLYTHPAHPLPIVQVAYRYTPVPWLNLGLNAHVGGIDGVGAGVFVMGQFKVGSSNQASIFYQADNLLGYLLTDQGSGIMMRGGLSFSLNN